MNEALLFDIDKTLTPPRLPITEAMVHVLNTIKIPFHVAAGSHLDLLKRQFFDPLYEYGFRKGFDAFISNGAIHYRCDYSEGQSIKEVSKFDIKEHLGQEAYHFLIETLERVLKIDRFKLPNQLKTLGETISYRVSMVNFVPIGRVEIELDESRANRESFVEFDQTTHYRENLIGYLNEKLHRLVETKDLVITLGGETSFDIGIRGEDKTKGITVLWRNGVYRVIFIGDALYKKGNDYAICRFVDGLPPEERSKAAYYQVASYIDTFQKLNQLGYSDYSIEKVWNRAISDLQVAGFSKSTFERLQRLQRSGDLFSEYAVSEISRIAFPVPPEKIITAPPKEHSCN